MTTPQRKKKIYDMLSPKIAKNRVHRKKVAAQEANDPKAPAKVDNYQVNKPKRARSLNMQPVIAERRNVAKTEGMPAINGKSGEEIVKKAVTKVKPKKPVTNFAAVVIPKSEVKDKKDAKPKRKTSTRKRTKKT